ncbi:hypothetical protein ACIBI4_31265 [Streptomyces sp. NPDC050418]|uniref:hypothetical protein n=1 Tax=Streptomyces sp. NPDC050418 TaxID=3365612 RepID=UPI00379DBD55
MDADVAYDLKFRRLAQRHRGQGLGLLLVAGALWAVALWLLFARQVPSASGACDPSFLASAEGFGECDYGAALGLPVFLLALSLLPAVLGAARYAAATTRLDLAEYHSALQALAHSQRLEDERRGAERPDDGR